VIKEGKGCPDQGSVLKVLDNELNVKANEKGVKRMRHEFLWKDNQRKFKKNSVNICK